MDLFCDNYRIGLSIYYIIKKLCRELIAWDNDQFNLLIFMHLATASIQAVHLSYTFYQDVHSCIPFLGNCKQSSVRLMNHIIKQIVNCDYYKQMYYLLSVLILV